MAILNSTVVNGDLSVTGNINAKSNMYKINVTFQCVSNYASYSSSYLNVASTYSDNTQKPLFVYEGSSQTISPTCLDPYMAELIFKRFILFTKQDVSNLDFSTESYYDSPYDNRFNLYTSLNNSILMDSRAFGYKGPYSNSTSRSYIHISKYNGKFYPICSDTGTTNSNKYIVVEAGKPFYCPHTIESSSSDIPSLQSRLDEIYSSLDDTESGDYDMISDFRCRFVNSSTSSGYPFTYFCGISSSSPYFYAPVRYKQAQLVDEVNLLYSTDGIVEVVSSKL